MSLSLLCSALPVHPGSHPEQEADADECCNEGGTAAELQTGGRAVGTGDSGEWGWEDEVKWRGGGEDEKGRGGKEGREKEERKGRREWGGGRYDQFWPVFCLKHKSVCFLIHTGREQAASSKPSQGSYLAYLAGSCLKQHAVWNYVCS